MPNNSLSASNFKYRDFNDSLAASNTLKARFYGHRFSGKARFSGQNCYDGTTVFSNSGNFNIADTLGVIFAPKVSAISFLRPFYENSRSAGKKLKVLKST